ncbi:hypothetical protein BZA05DRAFT_373563 [Tricharina praecox]|uniref:uncharacterized protein n=1 Tax=Tricharina praecox TaxID=43433 RepID=UPI002220010F|nr:uncharacterized protein BZA05DRAFT_373563 [Tricharina praecox]KAI5851857.1 hypothetical protein BZA05DRAFT_373563 [Tricharina praecox]
MSDSAAPADPAVPADPGLLRWTLGFLLVGMCWGLTNPFIRRAALLYTPTPTPSHNPIIKLLHTAHDLLRHPSYTIPLLLNLTGSVWFFLLIGQAELSLTVPIVNSVAFLFTVLGDWWADGKVVDRRTWAGIVAVCTGIGFCVWGKS